MLSSRPAEAIWVRNKPRRDWPYALLQPMVEAAFPRCRILESQFLTAGLRNANFKLRLDCSDEPFVLRIYEHDHSLCQKEIDVMSLVRKTVPVPEVIHAEPRGGEGLPPFALLRFVDGISPLDLKRGGDFRAFGQAAFSAGETLAAIGRFEFPRGGWLGPGPAVTRPLLHTPDAMPRFIDLCLATPAFALRVPSDVRDAIQRAVWQWSRRFVELEADPRLVHCDFSRRNLIAREVEGRWTIVAVLDWEFAVAGSPLIDIANFLRYEKASRPLAEPHFSAGYLRGGGTLPDDWRRVSRLLDLAATCDSLTREDLPEDIAVELVELVRATAEDRDARL